MIYGTGIDIVDVGRMAGIIARWGDRFLQRVFSTGERDYCRKRALPAMHYAARFAAKESVLKAFGIGLGMGISLPEVEVIHDRNGKPSVRLQGRAVELMQQFGISSVHLSLSHTQHSATAVVIMEQDGCCHA